MDRPQGGPVEPAARQSPDWAHVEDGFWRSLQATYDAEDKTILEEYKKQRSLIQMRLQELYSERHVAAERLRHIDATCSAEESNMELVNGQYEESRKVRFAMRDGTVAKMKAWFVNSRTAAAAPPPDASAPHKAMIAMNSINTTTPTMIVRPQPVPSVITSEPTGVEISDSSGQLLGPLRMIRIRNFAIDAVLRCPIKRRCKIRSNRKCNRSNLTTLYEPTDAKGGKWIACMIQATGEVQQKKCTNCDKTQGPFEDCIMLDGNSFTKCGNCEWSRQRCHGSSRDRSSTGGDAAQRLAFRAAGPRAAGILSPPSADGNSIIIINNNNNYLRHRQQDDDDDDESLMITPENLVVKHDGSVYTEPECVRGIPVAKIDRSHPYWDPTWVEVDEIIRPQWEKWQARQDVAVRSGSITQHAKFQIGRQVNRGKIIMDFLEKGSFSPYQLLTKTYMASGKGGIVTYDTLFRLANTIDELQQFRQPVKPVDWLRHRLHEILTTEGDRFNLSRTMHDFYHDPKLSALRKKCGFSQIGRPSGARIRASMAGGPTPPAKHRRSSNHESPRDTPRDTPPATPAFYRTPFALANPSSPQASPAINKEPSPADDDDTVMADQAADHDANVTDTDSYSGDPIEPVDFRIRQIKHRSLASNPNVTQYWHWLDDEGDRSFEHQVLKDTNPTQWGIYKPPVNFNVNFHDVTRICWASGSQRAVVRMKPTVVEDDGEPRGDILIHFKRDSTLRRFCKHVSKNGIKLSEISAEKVDEYWDEMRARVLPGKDDDDLIEV